MGPKKRSVAELLKEVTDADRGWKPPNDVIRKLVDEVVRLNHTGQTPRLGTRRVCAWLESDYDVRVGRDALAAWMHKRAHALGLVK